MRVKAGYFVVVLLLSAAAWLFGCGSGTRSTNPTPSSPNPAALPSLDLVLAEVESAPVPPGVDAELFEQLRTALLRELAARNGKLASAPPTGPRNTPQRYISLLLACDENNGHSAGMDETTRLRLDALLHSSRSRSSLHLAAAPLLSATPTIGLALLMFWRDFRCFFPCFLGY